MIPKFGDAWLKPTPDGRPFLIAQYTNINTKQVNFIEMLIDTGANTSFLPDKILFDEMGIFPNKRSNLTTISGLDERLAYPEASIIFPIWKDGKICPFSYKGSIIGMTSVSEAAIETDFNFGVLGMAALAAANISSIQFDRNTKLVRLIAN